MKEAEMLACVGTDQAAIEAGTAGFPGIIKREMILLAIVRIDKFLLLPSNYLAYQDDN